MSRSAKLHTVMPDEPAQHQVNVWRDPWPALVARPGLFGNRFESDIWIVPQHLAPRIEKTKLRIDFGAAIPLDWPDPESAVAVVRRLKRIAYLVAVSGTERLAGIGDSKSRRRTQTISASTWSAYMRAYIVAARYALSHGLASSVPDDCPDGTPLFSSLSIADIERMAAEALQVIPEALARLVRVREAGRISDAPQQSFTHKRGGTKDQNATMPLEDAHLTAVIEAALFLSDLSSRVTQVVMRLKDVPAGGRQAIAMRKILVQDAAQIIGARDLTGYTIARTSTRDPVRSLAEIQEPAVVVPQLFMISQTATAMIVAFATGMRPYELDALRRDCLEQTAIGTVLAGNAFKGGDEVQGVLRHWPLPRRAVEAIRRQQAIADCLEPGGDSLWCARPLGRVKTEPVSRQFTAHFRQIVDATGTVPWGDEPIYEYRIRTSVARLIALSIQGGPHAVSAVYGHDDIAQTKGYYRARGDFEQEMSRVTRDVRRAVGERLILEAKESTLPPRTASMVERTLDLVRDVAGVPKNGPRSLGTEDMAEAALIIGGDATVVRPGVLCTARGRFQGLCSQTVGQREPANCTLGCRFRFETAAALDDRRRRLAWHLDKIDGLDPSDLMRLAFHETGVIEAISGLEGEVNSYAGDLRLRRLVGNLSPEKIASFSEPARNVIQHLREDAL